MNHTVKFIPPTSLINYAKGLSKQTDIVPIEKLRPDQRVLFNIPWTEQDESLLDNDWLNDNIIDVWTAYLSQKKYSDTIPSTNYVIFNSQLHVVLSKDLEGTVNRIYPDDLLSKQLIFIPVNLGNTHWSLYVIFNLNKFDTNYNDVQIVYCDSLTTMKPNPLFIMKIKRSLYKFYISNNDLSFADDIQTKFDSISVSQASLPIQKNSLDCGVYMLRYIEEILELYFLEHIKFPIHYPTLFDEYDIKRQRTQIKKILSRMGH